MKTEEIRSQLECIASADDFEIKSDELTESWTSTGAGIETLEPVLRFMEEHPSIEFGVPGSLVHFVEQFNGNEYVKKLVESVERKPVAHTVWMLNRLINGTKGSERRRPLIAVLERARFNPLADQNTVDLATQFLERLQP